MLVVEDDALVRDMIVHELSFAGFEILEAGSAEDALALIAARGTIDLLFTDIRLPGIDGWQLAERVRSLVADVPIIYASGFADRVQPLAHSQFLQKPYRPSEVLQAAANLGIKLPQRR